MVEQLFKLEVLNGSYNQINVFPDFLSKLNQLKEINLEGFFLLSFFFQKKKIANKIIRKSINESRKSNFPIHSI